MWQIIAAGIVALSATWFGAWLSRRQTAAFNAQQAAEDARRHNREVVAAARLVWFELGAAAFSIEAAESTMNLVSLRGVPRTAWATHGALLAADLPPDVFAPLAEVMARLAAITGMIVGAEITATAIADHDEARRVLGVLREACRAAQETLAEWINAQAP